MAVFHCFFNDRIILHCMYVCVCICFHNKLWKILQEMEIYIYTHTHTYIYIYIYNIFLIQTSTDDHLGCYHVLNIINSKAVNVGAHVSFQFSVTFF